jgi:putative peptidoglycan lipid II flippase
LTEESHSQTGKIARTAGTVGVAVFFSRLLGLVREQVFAALFGAGYAYDAFVVAYRIPNLLRELFAEGALSAAFVTVFTHYDQREGPERTWRLANSVACAVILVVGGIALLGIFSSSWLAGLLAPDFGRIPGKLDLTTVMTRIMFPFLPLISLAALAMGVLNSKGKFFIPAIASSFFNLGSIGAGVALALAAPVLGFSPIVGMAWGTLIGGALQLVVQLPAVFKLGFRPGWALDFKDEGLRRILWLMLPAVVGLSATQINVFINTFYASSCAQGSVSWLNYAYRVMFFPMGIFGAALSIATLPVVSRQAARGDLDTMKRTVRSSLSLSFLVTIPAALGLVVLATPIIALLFQHGKFTAADTGQTSNALAFFALGLFAYAGVKIVVPVFYALNDTRVPVIGSFLTVGTNLLIINLTLAPLQHQAIALSMSLSGIFNFLFLSLMLYRKVGDFEIKYLLGLLAKVTAAGLVMAVVVSWFYFFQSGRLAPGLGGRIISLFSSIGVGVGVYGLIIFALKIPEFQELTDKLKARWMRR